MSVEGFAENYSTQRRRLVKARTPEELDQALQTITQQWSSEAATVVSTRPSFWTNRSSARTDPPDFLSGWKQEALEQTVTLPDIPRPPAPQEYVGGSLFVPVPIDVPNAPVQLFDYILLRTVIEHASKFRLVERASVLANYPVSKPTLGTFPPAITYLEPKHTNLSWYEYLSAELRLRRQHAQAYNSWRKQLLLDRELYFTSKKADFEAASRDCLSQWEKSKLRWEQNVAADRARLHVMQLLYQDGSPTEYFNAVLSAVPLPAWCPRDLELQFNPDEKVLLIECQLPYFGNVEIMKTRISSSGSKWIAANQRETREFTAQFPYLLALRLMWEIPQIDYRQQIDLICCNGYVVYDDPATGRRRRDIIMSVVAKREDLEVIRLDRIEPEACFRKLKGVAAAKLWELVPVRPLIQFNKDDKRFIAAKDVLSGTGENTNLATMEWQDFEHLIRDVFEKEFASDGGEVKVTQASRDRGVDAVVFDPDPLRGGKFIIQAKRYTNTVDVSAVRDLYGTVINEGASRGILVTTSNYGRDAHEFAKDKPITLLNGAHLLHLLNKHGYALRIDLKEARDLQRE